jgi:hypothetical protein
VPSYKKGTMVRVTATFRDTNTTPVDPTTVTCTAVDGNGTTRPQTVVKDSVGNYHADINADTSGLWSYQFKGTGTNQGADEGTFDIAPSRFG